jgi:hypothetical protein
LQGEFEITAGGLGNWRSESVRVVALEREPPGRLARTRRVLNLALRRFAAVSRLERYRVAVDVPQGGWSVVIANDPEVLPLGVEIAESCGARVLYDAHEFAPRQYEHLLRWRLLRAPVIVSVLRAYLPRVAAMTTVNEALAEAYEREFGIRPSVITNACEAFALTPQPLLPGRIRLLHHGGASRPRRLETMIEAMRWLDERFTLDLMLMNAATPYGDFLRGLAARSPRVRILDPVAFDDLVPSTNAYDVGLTQLPPLNFNLANALPNKFFEYVQARLAVVIGPTPTMQAFVDRYGFGLVTDDFTPRSLARTLSTLTPERLLALKEASHRAASVLHAGANAATLRALVGSLARDAAR